MIFVVRLYVYLFLNDFATYCLLLGLISIRLLVRELRGTQDDFDSTFHRRHDNHGDEMSLR